MMILLASHDEGQIAQTVVDYRSDNKKVAIRIADSESILTTPTICFNPPAFWRHTTKKYSGVVMGARVTYPP